MRAYVYLNEAEDHFFGWRPEHMDRLELAGEFRLQDDGQDDLFFLEYVFAVCNGMDVSSHDLWYAHGNRSLSVGDVIVLVNDGIQVTWVCDPFGWTKLLEQPILVLPVQLPDSVI